MDAKPTVATIIDLLREILYDILGLFLPGVAFLLILRQSSIWVLHSLAESLSKGESTSQIAIFVGASYVLGYAVQGIAGTFWIPMLNFFGKLITLPGKLRTLPAKIKALPETLRAFPANINQKVKNWFSIPPAETAVTEVTGVAPAGRQTKDAIQKSELFKALREQLGDYCKLGDPNKLSVNEVQNLAFSVAGDRSANAFRFSFRADLCNGMFVVFSFGAVITIIEYWWRAQADQRRLLLTALIYVLLSIAFYLRAKFYYNIRGRIIYTIALVVLAELRWSKGEKTKQDVP
jgi:hypothetical protein